MHSFADIHLLELYPTTLTNSDLSPRSARPWTIGTNDLFRISSFSLAAGAFHLTTGKADLGLGKSRDGAVFAVIIPDQPARLESPAATNPEFVTHIWVRFHPLQLETLFPPDTVSRGAKDSSLSFMRLIADTKIHSSFQAGGLAMIPATDQLIADSDITNGLRRFFVLDRKENTAQYVNAFERQPVPRPATFEAALAERAFDEIWNTFDQDYAMFILRPEVDWDKLRERFRPRAMAATSTSEFASICAEMLSQLRDLHVSVMVAGHYIPCFDRPRFANANPAAIETIVGPLQRAGAIAYATTPDKIGYLQVSSLSGRNLENDFDAALEKLIDSRALILDVRLNGGGSEETGRHIASRFVEHEFTYAYSRFRNGKQHTNLTDFLPRTVKPGASRRYDKPVALLIGQKCMSSAESFVAMMSGATNVTTMGDHTCGSSGNPKRVDLPLSLSVTISQWIDYLPDRTPIDERGVQPQTLINANPAELQSGRDPVLETAMRKFQAAH